MLYAPFQLSNRFTHFSLQFTARDCLLLAKCVAKCKTLKTFRLNRSKVDDDKVCTKYAPDLYY